MKIIRWLRVFFLTVKITVSRHYRTIGLSILVTIILGYAGYQIKVRLDQRPHAYIVGLVTDLDTNGELPDEIKNLLSRGLTRLDDHNNVKPALATSWSSSDQGKEYIFTLRDDLYWDDGTKLSAHDLHFNISGVETDVVSDNKIRFALKNAYSPFPSILSEPVLKNDRVGLGPYRLIELENVEGKLDSVTVVKDSSHYKIKIYPNEELGKTALKLGEVDALAGIRSPEELINWPQLIPISYFPNNRFVAVFFNTQYQFLGDKETRQALAYAIPEDFPGEPIKSPIDRDSWAYNPDVKEYPFDITQAQKLLSASEGAQLTLTTLPIYEDLARLIARSWEKLGLDVSLDTLDELPVSGQFQALLIGQKIPSDPDQYSLWHSTQKTNLTTYQSPKVDKLLEDARKIEGREERKELYHKFQEQLSEDVPAVFLYRPEEYVLLSERAKGTELQQFVGDLVR